MFTEIILKPEKTAVRLSGAESTKRVIINAVGPKEVTAADIISDADMEIFNPIFISPHWKKTHLWSWRSTWQTAEDMCCRTEQDRKQLLLPLSPLIPFLHPLQR